MTTPQEQTEFLGNGTGMVYYTDSSGVLGASLFFPNRGQSNGVLAKKKAIAVGFLARKRAFNTRATMYVTITNAVADNLTVFTIGGVSQITAPVGMTIGNPTLSVVDIVAAINSTVTSPDWTAVANGATFSMQCQTVGAAGNNLAVVMTFSGASTASHPAVTSGGIDSNEYSTRIFLDTDPAAVPTVLNMGSAVEITSALAANSPNPPTDVAVVASALTFTRKDTDNVVAATGGGTVNNVFMADAQVGDTATVYAKAGEPALTIATGVGNITLSTGTSYVSSGPTKSLSLQYREVTAGVFGWVEASSRIEATPANIRASGSIVPQTAGITNIGVTLGGAGANYVLGGTNPYSVRMTGTGNLTGNYTLSLSAGTGILDGDMGIITGQGSAITYIGANTMAISGITIPASLALTGSWSIAWQYQAAVGFMVSLMPDITRPNITGTSQIIDGAVTDAKIAPGIDGAKLLANSVGYGAVDPMIQAMLVGGGILYAEVTIASAAVLTLNTTPIQIVAAPGAGFALVLQKWTANMIFNTTAYATNTGLVVRNPPVAAVYDQGINPFFLTSVPAPGTVIWTMCSIRENVTNTQIIENQPLEVAVIVGDPTAGDSDIQVRIWYSIIAV